MIWTLIMGQILKDYQFLRLLLDHGLIINMMEVLRGVLLIPSLKSNDLDINGSDSENLQLFQFVFNKL